MNRIGRVLVVFLSRFLVLFVRRLKDLTTQQSRENKGMEEVRSLLLSSFTFTATTLIILMQVK